MKRILSFFAFLMIAFSSFAQEDGVEMADALRSNGKIYVVVTVLMVIFIGIVLYLVRIDRKLSKLESGQKK